MRSLMTWKPMAHGSPLTREMGRFFDEFAKTQTEGWIPSADVLERSDHYVVQLDLPGLTRDEIKVDIEDGHLKIHGSRKFESREESDQLLRSERFSGEFVRSFRLGDRVSPESIDATYVDGVLEVKIPKAEEARPRQIEVK